MRDKAGKLLAVGVLALLAGTIPIFGQSKKSEPATTMPKVGEAAPDFQLDYFDGNDLKKISLEQYRGKKNVVLAFYIYAFTGG